MDDGRSLVPSYPSLGEIPLRGVRQIRLVNSATCHKFIRIWKSSIVVVSSRRHRMHVSGCLLMYCRKNSKVIMPPSMLDGASYRTKPKSRDLRTDREKLKDAA